MRPARTCGSRQRWPSTLGENIACQTHPSQPSPQLCLCNIQTGAEPEAWVRACATGPHAGYKDSWVYGLNIYIFSEASPSRWKGPACPCLRGPLVPRVAAAAWLGLLHGVVPKMLAAISVAGVVLHVHHCGQPCTPCKPGGWCPVVDWADCSAPTVASVCSLVRDNPDH